MTSFQKRIEIERAKQLCDAESLRQKEREAAALEREAQAKALEIGREVVSYLDMNAVPASTLWIPKKIGTIHVPEHTTISGRWGRESIVPAYKIDRIAQEMASRAWGLFQTWCYDDGQLAQDDLVAIDEIGALFNPSSIRDGERVTVSGTPIDTEGNYFGARYITGTAALELINSDKIATAALHLTTTKGTPLRIEKR